MQTVARLAIAAPRRIVAVALLVLVGTGIFGVPSLDAQLGENAIEVSVHRSHRDA
jgi:putative drug exporter of the RND superfamily